MQNDRQNYELTPKEHFKVLFSRGVSKRLPTARDYFMFNSRILPENSARKLVRDAQDYTAEDDPNIFDMFGIEWIYVPEVQGATVKPGHPVLSDISEWHTKITFPDIESWNWEENAGINEEFLNLNSDKLIVSTILTGFFERLISFLDFENACISLVDEESAEEVHALFAKLCELYEGIILKLKTYYNVDLIELHDDWGSQRSPLFSLELCMEMIVPYLKRVVDFTHKHGMYFQLHSCGCNEELVPAMLAAGVDLWIPQFTANNLESIQERYGDRIILGSRPILKPDISEQEVCNLIDAHFEMHGKNMRQKPVLFFGRIPSEAVEDYFQKKYQLFLQS